MQSLSTYWNSHRHNENGLHMVFETLLLGFECMELGQDLPSVLLPGFYETIEKNKNHAKPFIRFSGVHHFCPLVDEPSARGNESYEFTSPLKECREKAIGMTKKSIDFASDMEAKHVVLHLGQAPMKDYSTQLVAMLREGQLYSKSYAALKLEMIQAHEELKGSHLDGVRLALDELIPYAEHKGILLGLESGGRYEQVPNEREMDLLLLEYDSPAIGYWHDFGHIQLKANLGLLNHQQYLEKMLPRLIGCHLHDVVWPVEDHAIPFHGDIDFDQLIPLLPKNIPMVWMMNPRRKSNDIKAALITWKEKYGD